MAKKVVATLKKEGGGKELTKCIKLVKSEKSGSYTFKEEMVLTGDVKEFFDKK